MEALARALVAAGNLDCNWLTAFLDSAGYPNSRELIAELFPATADPGPADLPLPPTPFVGRQGELADLAALLAKPNCRLITLVGPGGSGKTRLALEAAKSAHATFADGATFVALAPIASADFVAATTATALHITLAGHAPSQSQLLHYLRRQARLIVLDNFEHLLTPAPMPADEHAALDLVSGIIAESPHTKVLVTSRERLNIQGEWVYDVGGLEMPNGDGNAPATTYGAPTLFLQTAQRLQTSFAPTAADEAAIIDICRSVEGMPLALELAASWVRVLSCREIAAEIAANLNFLTTKQRDLPQRHRSMWAVFDHSWQLLSPEEQRVFARCSVFRAASRARLRSRWRALPCRCWRRWWISPCSVTAQRTATGCMNWPGNMELPVWLTTK